MPDLHERNAGPCVTCDEPTTQTNADLEPQHDLCAAVLELIEDNARATYNAGRETSWLA